VVYPDAAGLRILREKKRMIALTPHQYTVSSE
jgi:hypothetical protein